MSEVNLSPPVSQDPARPNPNPSGDAPAANAWLNQEGWAEHLADDLKGDVNLVRYKTPDAALRALSSANKRFGVPQERLLTVPDKSRTEDPAAWAAFDKINGVPEDVAGYGMALPDGTAPEVKTLFEGLAGKLRGLGVGKEAFGAVLQAYADGQKADHQAQVTKHNAEVDAAKAAISSAFGAKEGYYKDEIGKLLLDAKGADGQPLIGAEGVERLNKLGWGQNLDFIKLMAWVVDQKAEPESLPGGGGAGNVGGRGMTPTQARAERLALEADATKGKALLNKNDPLHASVVEERRRLLSLENPAVKFA